MKSTALFEPVSLVDYDDDDLDLDHQEEEMAMEYPPDDDGDCLEPDFEHRNKSSQNSVELVRFQRNISGNEGSGVTTMENVLMARRLLYVSHFFAQFSEVAWQFGLAFFLAACTNYQSMILVSSYGLIVNLSVFFVGPALGRHIDASHRLSTARRFIVCENTCVLIATAFCYLLLSTSTLEPQDKTDVVVDTGDVEPDLNWLQLRLQHVPTDTLSVIALIGIHLMGATAQVMDQAFLVAMERDWVVVLSRAAALAFHDETNQYGDSETTMQAVGEQEDDDDSMIDSTFRIWLSDTNVAMKQIDLSCKVAAPAVAGFFIPFLSAVSTTSGGVAYYDFTWGCIVIGAMNVMALIVEFVCTARVYHLIPALAVKDSSTCATTFPTSKPRNAPCENTENDVGNRTKRYACLESVLPRGLFVYLQQSSAFGGLGLAMLYSNSLTMGNGIMTTYLLFRGLNLEVVGILRGVASAIGLLGTVVYHFSAKHMSLETTGMWSISYQFACLTLTLVSLSISNDIAALTLLIGCVCLSRIGLWVFDIAVTQLQQQEIPDHIRGQVGGVQSSLNNGFSLVSFVIGILFPDPNDFFLYVTAGVFGVGTAVMLFLFGIFLPRRAQ